MTMQEFIDFQENNFIAYCKVVIRNEGKDVRKEIVSRSNREINLSMLAPAEQERPASHDIYDLDRMTFWVCGVPVEVRDPALCQALSSLTPYRRNVILLSYFMERSDPQIGAALRRDSTTVNYQRKRTLRRLKEVLEALGYEP